MRFLLFLPLLASAEPLTYECRFSETAPKIDGDLSEAAWEKIAWTSDFTDIRGKEQPAPRFRTRAKMLWTADGLHVAAEIEEPHVWGTLTEKNAIIFHDNDFEIFLDPDGDTLNYYEFEINALNTGWDLLLDKPYRHGGKARNSWEIPGLRTAVHVRGTLNDARDRDQDWSVELAFPWKVLAEYSKQAAPPKPGDEWRVNFSRVEWQHEIVGGVYRKVPGTKEDNWTWTVQGLVNMHVPEMWGRVRFLK
jgi:hypothetical protein